jgi:hypothetical protein
VRMEDLHPVELGCQPFSSGNRQLSVKKVKWCGDVLDDAPFARIRTRNGTAHVVDSGETGVRHQFYFNSANTMADDGSTELRNIFAYVQGRNRGIEDSAKNDRIYEGSVLGGCSYEKGSVHGIAVYGLYRGRESQTKLQVQIVG